VVTGVEGDGAEVAIYRYAWIDVVLVGDGARAKPTHTAAAERRRLHRICMRDPHQTFTVCMHNGWDTQTAASKQK
jgi:acyl dehydratase